MSDEELATAVDFIKGCYRVLVEIRDEIRAMRKSGTPTQAALPLDEWLPAPGEVARRIAAAPRAWGNTVRWYEAAYKWTGGGPFGLGDIFAAHDAIAEATKGKIGVATYQRILSALVRAGAATRKGGVYALRQPTDELREAVERVRNTKGGAR